MGLIDLSKYVLTLEKILFTYQHIGLTEATWKYNYILDCIQI
jgi:hypothetical protein